jgi:hypothetical protein
MQYIEIRKPDNNHRRATHVPDAGVGMILLATVILLLAVARKKLFC